MDERKLKYLVSFDPQRDQYMVGYTRDWNYHDEIQATFPAGFKPMSGGHFSISLVDHDWVPSSIQTFGKSEAFRIVPNLRDRAMLVQIFQAELEGELLKLFDADGQGITKMPQGQTV